MKPLLIISNYDTKLYLLLLGKKKIM